MEEEILQGIYLQGSLLGNEVTAFYWHSDFHIRLQYLIMRAPSARVSHRLGYVLPFALLCIHPLFILPYVSITAFISITAFPIVAPLRGATTRAASPREKIAWC